eukprot:snap_masked-scaffold_12-processed-gene-11.51-mRNA-1 protein AED:0.11 eAED:0.65 QI:0/-1/0/1/-1/1/1/0/448
MSPSSPQSQNSYIQTKKENKSSQWGDDTEFLPEEGYSAHGIGVHQPTDMTQFQTQKVRAARRNSLDYTRLRPHRESVEDIRVIADLLHPKPMILTRNTRPNGFANFGVDRTGRSETREGVFAAPNLSYFPRLNPAGVNGLHFQPIQSNQTVANPHIHSSAFQANLGFHDPNADFPGYPQAYNVAAPPRNGSSTRSLSTTSTNTTSTYEVAGCGSNNQFLWGGYGTQYEAAQEELKMGQGTETKHESRKEISQKFLNLVSASGYKEADDRNCDKKFYHCSHPGCQRVFSWEWSLREHEHKHVVEKTKKRNFVCDYPKCSKAFFTKSCLKSHLKIHTRKPNSFVCKVAGCDKTYSTGEGLRLHTRNHHEIDKRWECPSEGCSKKFVRQSDMRLHILRIHSEERPHPCKHEGCTKSFACFSELRRHELSHIRKLKKIERMKRHMKMSMQAA